MDPLIKLEDEEVVKMSLDHWKGPFDEACPRRDRGLKVTKESCF